MIHTRPPKFVGNDAPSPARIIRAWQPVAPTVLHRATLSPASVVCTEGSGSTAVVSVLEGLIHWHCRCPANEQTACFCRSHTLCAVGIRETFERRAPWIFDSLSPAIPVLLCFSVGPLGLVRSAAGESHAFHGAKGLGELLARNFTSQNAG